MKKFLSIFAFAAIALACLSSCGGDDDDSPSTPATMGVATRTGGASVKWVQLWKDGPKFAEYNIGAKSFPSEYGILFYWGSNKDIEKVSDRTYKEGEGNLTGTDDTATDLWGKNWRMPTKEEFDDLLTKCDVVWTETDKYYAKGGVVITGKGDYASNSIFLPAAGSFDSGYGVHDKGYLGRYWSSTYYSGGLYYAYALLFTDPLYPKGKVERDERFTGCSIRPVLAE